MRHHTALLPALALVLLTIAGTTSLHAVPTVPLDTCVAQDDAGTASLPADCRLASRTDAAAVATLSTGDQLEMRFNVDSFFDVTYVVDPGTGDEIATFGAFMTMHLDGLGGLAGYERTLTIPVQMQTLHAARPVGASTQTFPTEMISMQGEIFGDPDFDLFRVTAGSALGLPSPGQTTLTRLPRGDFNVDSFFDIEYRIEFQGSPGGLLGGESLNRTFTLEVRVNRIEMAIAAPNPGGSADIPADERIAPAAGESLLVTAGLPTDSSFRLRPRAEGATIVSTGVGSLGGPSYVSSADFEVVVAGEGGLSALRRTLIIPHVLELHAAPSDPAADVQEIPTEMISLQGEIFGDPDFDLLRLTAGSDSGLPSPGHTTLTRLPSGNFNVDSFFDIEYRIEFQGSPGGALAGASGVQTGSLRLLQGGDLPKFTLHTHGPEVEPLGGVRLEEVPATGGEVHLRLTNIGSSGKDGVDGVSFDLGDGEPTGFAVRLDMGPAGAMPPGAECRVDLLTGGASATLPCDPCQSVTLSAQQGGTLGVSVESTPPLGSSSRVVRLRDGGGSVRMRSFSPGVGGVLATGALGTTPDGALRVQVEKDTTSDPGGAGGGGRVVIRVINATPAPMQLTGDGDLSSGNELQISLDGLPPGEPVTGALISCSGMPDVTIPGFDLLSPKAARGFDPDPDNNCTVGVDPPKMGTTTGTGGDGTPIPYIQLTEIGANSGGLLATADLDRDGLLDTVREGDIQFTVGPEQRMPADSVLRLDAGSESCGFGDGAGGACSLGLELERPGSGEAVGRLAVFGFTPREVTVAARSGGADQDTVSFPQPIPPELFSGELRGQPLDPMMFDIAVVFDDLFCGCDVDCECVVMHLRAPSPAPIQLTGSSLGPVTADELELRLALEPLTDGVPIELISMSLHGTQLCEADIYSTRLDSLLPDRDGDGIAGAGSGGADCDDTDSSFWSTPGEVRDLRVDPALVRWSPPTDAGGLPGLLLYDTLASSDASDFSSAECLETNDGDDTEAQFLSLPGIGDATYTLTRAGNGCPNDGTLGAGGGGAGGSIWVRTGPVCP